MFTSGGLGLCLAWQCGSNWGLYLPQVNPYRIHGIHQKFKVESMESIWLRPQPICCSMDIMDSIWNGGISTLDSMDKSIWIPWKKSIWIPLKFHMENTIIFVVKNSVGFEGWALGSAAHHMCKWESTLTAAPSDHYKTITWPWYILCPMASTNNNNNNNNNNNQPVVGAQCCSSDELQAWALISHQ